MPILGRGVSELCVLVIKSPVLSAHTPIWVFFGLGYKDLNPTAKQATAWGYSRNYKQNDGLGIDLAS